MKNATEGTKLNLVNHGRPQESPDYKLQGLAFLSLQWQLGILAPPLIPYACHPKTRKCYEVSISRPFLSGIEKSQLRNGCLDAISLAAASEP